MVGSSMSPLASDPVVLGECVVIVMFGAFDVWWFLPAQRRKRRRAQARERVLLRRLFVKSADRAGADTEPTHDRPRPHSATKVAEQ
jgi:hypothetical protein